MADIIESGGVLVVGAGPVGLMAAVQLVRHGVPVRVVDAADGPASTSRALNLHARSLEILDGLGLADELIGRGRITTAFERHVAGRPPQRYRFAHRGRSTRFDYMLVVDQVITEESLRRHLAGLGVQVEWGTRLTGFADTGTGVTATVAGARSDERLDCRWLVGCDGAHSTVRRQLGVPLHGDSADTWLVADAVVRTDLDVHAAHWLFGADGALMMFAFPEPGKWRLVDTAARPGSAADPAQLATAFAGKLSDATGTDVRVEPVLWQSLFTIQQRAVPSMRQGFCLLAGDAAHVHSPAGGQGMNTGLQDAVNLGWKVAAEVRGLAGPELLDSYSAERVPIGAALLDSTAAVTRYVTGDDLRDDPEEALAAAGRTIIGAANGLAVAYPDSPLTTGNPGQHGPRPGERITQVDAEHATRPGWRTLLAAIARPDWTLLCGTEAPATPASLGSWAETSVLDHPTAADLGAGPGDWLLVRPDGYLAARGGRGTPVPLPHGYHGR